MSPYDSFLLLTCFAGAYLIGSIPFAYLVVFLTHRFDLTRKGSSNVGAMNAYEVTGSRLVGVSIGLLDAIKGALAVGIAAWTIGAEASPPPHVPLAAIAGVVAGHNYNLWLSLQSGHLEGGKGLAAAAGALLVFQPYLVGAWALLYAAGIFAYGLWSGSRRIIVGNVVATGLLPVAAYAIYGSSGTSTALVLAVLVLPKHWRQLRQLLGSTEPETAS